MTICEKKYVKAMYLYQLELSFNNEKVRKPIFLKFGRSL